MAKKWARSCGGYGRQAWPHITRRRSVAVVSWLIDKHGTRKTVRGRSSCEVSTSFDNARGSRERALVNACLCWRGVSVRPRGGARLVITSAAGQARKGRPPCGPESGARGACHDSVAPFLFPARAWRLSLPAWCDVDAHTPPHLDAGYRRPREHTRKNVADKPARRGRNCEVALDISRRPTGRNRRGLARAGSVAIGASVAGRDADAARRSSHRPQQCAPAKVVRPRL